MVEDFGDLAGHAVDIAENHIVAPRGDGRWRSTRAVWFSSTATSWSPSSFSCRGLPTVGRPSFPVAAALSDNTVPASVQNRIVAQASGRTQAVTRRDAGCQASVSCVFTPKALWHRCSQVARSVIFAHGLGATSRRVLAR